MQPEITPAARRLAEATGVAWHTLPRADGTITEQGVLEYLSRVVTGDVADTVAAPTGPLTAVDFSSLAASLTEAMHELLADSVTAEKVTAETLSGTVTTSGSERLEFRAQLEAEQRAHAATRAQLDKLEATLKRQKILAAQLKPLSAEIRRLGSALGLANAEMERLRPLEGLIGTLQAELKQAQADEASARLLCRELQLQNDLEQAKREQRRRWQFWRRAS